MQQTFVKTLSGHALQFNRLLYPVRYQITLKDMQHNGEVIAAHRNDRGRWSVEHNDRSPRWMLDIVSDIQMAIEDNESVPA